MRPPRVRLASLTIAVTAVAVNLGIIRTFRDTPEAGSLITTLPTVNVLAALALIGLRRRRLRAFAAGFVAAGVGSLIGFHAWAEAHPWTFLRYVEPLGNAIDRCISQAIPDLHTAAFCAAMIVGFMAPHAIAGLAGGGLMAGGSAILSRKDWPGDAGITVA